jgi:putative transposase
MIRTCKVKLSRAHKQEARLLGIIYLCRQLYNAALQQRIEAYQKQGVTLSLFDQEKELTRLRAEEENYKFLTRSMTRLSVLDRLDKAFKGFFRRIKTGEKPGFPRFKGQDRFDTLIFDKIGWKIVDKKLVIRNGTGNSPITLTMRNMRHRQGEIKGLRLVKKANRWWAHFLVDVGEAPKVKTSKNGVGIDVGLRTFATMSDGEQIEHPRFLQKSQDRLRAAQQAISRKKKGSNNRAKAKLALVRAHEKVKNRRKNFVFQTVAGLAAKYDGFAIENLDIQEMTNSKKQPEGLTKKGARGLRRGIMDSAWSLFATQLENKAEEAGFPVVRVDPKGTSQRCSACGSLVRKTLRDRVHECHACGLVLDRDLNAARNILDKAKNNPGCGLAAGSLGGQVDGAEVLKNKNHIQNIPCELGNRILSLNANLLKRGG